ncbi:MAG: phosphoribosyltransferase family protein [Flavobacteriales bacterium]
MFGSIWKFIRLKSYESTGSNGKITKLTRLRDSFKDRGVVVLEDIIDTVITIAKVTNDVLEKNPKDVKVASMFLKPEIYKGVIKLDYAGMEVPSEFIVGYGLDIDGLGRNRNSVYKKIDSVSLWLLKKIKC